MLRDNHVHGLSYHPRVFDVRDIEKAFKSDLCGDDYSSSLLKYSIKFHSCVPRASDFYRKCIIDNSWTVELVIHMLTMMHTIFHA